MRYEYFTLWLMLSIGYVLSQVRADKGVIIVTSTAGIPLSALTPAAASKSKPSAASPQLTTTPPTPSLSEVKPTTAPSEAAAVIANEPPKLSKKTAQKESTQDKVAEPLPHQTASTNVSSPLKVATPQLVTGFITKNGNIYEVTDQQGIGLIESRQSPESNTAPHICNYGSVLVYSDAPCDELADVVRIREIHEQGVNTNIRQQETPKPQEPPAVVQPPAADNNVTKTDTNLNANKKEEFADFDEYEPPVPKKRKQGNKNKKNKRKRNGIKNRPNAVRQGSGNKRRPQVQKQQQRRRSPNTRNKSSSKQQRRRRVPQKQFSRRSQNGYRNRQRNRGQNFNRRRLIAYDDYDY